MAKNRLSEVNYDRRYSRIMNEKTCLRCHHDSSPFSNGGCSCFIKLDPARALRAQDAVTSLLQSGSLPAPNGKQQGFA
jgi:hypothetical protein